MRELTIGEKAVRVRATPLALLFYQQEFKSDLIGDMIKMQSWSEDQANFNSIACLQLIWAMAKADAYGKPFPSFEGWLATLDSIDLSDTGFLVAALEEAADGFLRRAKRQTEENS